MRALPFFCSFEVKRLRDSGRLGFTEDLQEHLGEFIDVMIGKARVSGRT